MDDNFYTEEHQIFRDSFRKFVAREITPHIPGMGGTARRTAEHLAPDGERGFLVPLAARRIRRAGLGIRIFGHHQ